MQFIDLQAQYQEYKAQIDAAITRVLNHGKYLFGPELETLEKQLADYVGVTHCIAASSGTTALHVALLALDVQPGDEIITTPFSFFATAEVIYLLGAKPIYVDIDPMTYLIDPALLEAAITSKTKAIIPVSLYGQCADMDTIQAVANRHGIPVIEDAAQSLGATYKDKKSCALSEIACTSFFPSKPLGAYGDGGACFTNDDKLAEKMRLIVNHGQESRYNHVAIGMNGRMDSIQAAVLIEKLAFFEKEIAKRQVVASWYRAALPDFLSPPQIASYNKSVYAQYTVQVDDRENVVAQLSKAGVPTAVHYPVGLHQQPIVAKLSSEKLSFPITERCAKRVLSLPFHPYLDEKTVKQICAQLEDSVSVK
ncbi:MAG: aminotransferase DegT [Gammaproteobacteria bacterium CG_4_10_14_0_8_um_filter_38_16]|nr:MAG: aminotransferase DegT [Gammaproteobacteria bacterium CG_4_10_14_0_8_um_filter_38_16]PJA04359.1 MAG: aminotransferase DegT [Gammaproteobacteria bacterium CG_4_10_14_0_2_um_filter_38_22]PJB09548.1 MAG: aminotransferase DegT [Gammaproteobacteria bacterium CG_4_9_14_3_um_filter_38_9]